MGGGRTPRSRRQARTLRSTSRLRTTSLRLSTMARRRSPCRNSTTRTLKARLSSKVSTSLPTLHFTVLTSFMAGDVLDIMEHRHDWAKMVFTPELFKYVFFNLIPEVLVHSQSQDEEQVRGHYDRKLDKSPYLTNSSPTFLQVVTTFMNGAL